MAQLPFSETAEVVSLNDRSGKAIAGIIFLMMLAGGSTIDTSSSSGSTSDGVDDGGSEDPGPDDPGEPQCSDGIDNDGDGMVDENDPDCDPNNPDFDETEG